MQLRKTHKFVFLISIMGPAEQIKQGDKMTLDERKDIIRQLDAKQKKLAKAKADKARAEKIIAQLEADLKAFDKAFENLVKPNGAN